MFTLPKTNIKSPLKMGRNAKGNDRIPTIHFQGRLLLVSGGVNALEFFFPLMTYKIPNFFVAEVIVPPVSCCGKHAGLLHVPWTIMRKTGLCWE